MTTLPRDTSPATPERSLGQRLFARHGSTAILAVVLLVVVGWIGILGWAMTWMLG
ncbi:MULTISPECIES: hypothetical protein [Methylobacterium]|jgi:hypothetical protein|uniref:Uncharacterized protein n=1 Tax=Methylobacterium brachiatum TaxID=269660 RepID=A0AAJ1U1E3_9HYPH|nr:MULTISPECIES: hypothetical protein [Methylobacterium]EIZ81925.1 hypothetical protein WYO_5429 [Methylobacterium sp. GXF4]MCB4806586.1 hypothetical protein [Methylobacterium brachiatum]MDQ0547637.1 hypothetical protein [Methylobacterium brachiatum]CAA2157932.1 hypothetical protein MBRA_03284 [Methylobacterium brachiatum]SFJ81243.1 hypothetical protein SAMN02799642_05582 [Methylobacterium brachiatum]